MTTASTGSTSGRTITLTWLALSAITVASWWLAPAHGEQNAVASVPITIAVVALGAVKGRLIIRNFMEVSGAPRWLQWATDAWLTVLWTAILATYLY